MPNGVAETTHDCPAYPRRAHSGIHRPSPVPDTVGAVDDKAVPLRLDVWLDVACLFKTRSEAQRACKGGKVDVNGQAAKPHREIKSGDVIDITRALGRRQRVIVKGTAEQHVPKAEARHALRGRHAAALGRGTGAARPRCGWPGPRRPGPVPRPTATNGAG